MCIRDRRQREGVWDIFVEQIKLYHSLKVHDNCIFIYGDMGLKMKTLTDQEKKVVPNSDGECFSLILSFQSFFVPNSDGLATFCS